MGLRPWVFYLKIAFLCVGATACLVWIGSGGLSIVAPAIILACLCVHAVELQHQCLHYTAFRSRFANRATGFLLGVPLFVSFSDYQRSHMFHHRMLGRPENHEFFDYDHDSLRTVRGLLAYMFMFRHYRRKAVVIFKAMATRLPKGDPVDRKIAAEHRAIGFIFAAACLASAVLRSPAVLTMWVLPFIVAVPIHALVELPEHLGCDLTTTDIFRNTRTIRASRFSAWFTNGNNYHVEHHYLPSAPIDRLADLHQAIRPGIVYLDDSYWAFYKRVFLEAISPRDKGERK